MDKLLDIVKLIAIIQIIVIITFIAFAYFTNQFIKYKNKKNKIKTEQINNLLNLLITRKIDLSKADIIFFKNSIYELLICCEKFNKKYPDQSEGNPWVTLKNHLSLHVFKPTARLYYNSQQWFKRYIAVLCFSYGVDDEDEHRLRSLVLDKLLLISINASMVVEKFPSDYLIRTLIESFSSSKSLQQTAYAEILSLKSELLPAFFLKQLAIEQDSNKKIFCYKMLTELPAHQVPTEAKHDVLSLDPNLKAAVLDYISKINTPEAKAILATSSRKVGE